MLHALSEYQLVQGRVECTLNSSKDHGQGLHLALFLFLFFSRDTWQVFHDEKIQKIKKKKYARPFKKNKHPSK